MTTLKIKVTKDILHRSMLCGINPGERVAENCAIALAVRDIFPNALVIPGEIVIYKGGVRYRVALPEEATEFIYRFDGLKDEYRQRLDLPELEFEVNIPDSVIELINIDEVRKLLVDHPTLEFVQ